MELNIAATIRALRKEKGITQEELANDIGVTAQAVSKWERSEGYPDITLLPDMAAYFGVSLDTLCGIDEQRTRRKIEAILRATSDASSYEDGVNIAREGVAAFPHSVSLKKNLARALMGCTGAWTPPREVAEEVIGLYEQIRDPSELSSTDHTLLCEAYLSIGARKKAVQVAERVEGRSEIRRLWCRLLQGEALVAHIQSSIIQTMPDIHFLVQEALKTDVYTAREKIALCQKLIDVYALLDEGRDWPIGMIFSYGLYLRIAVLSMQLQDAAASLAALDKAADLAVRTDSLPCEGFPSSLLLNRISFRDLYGSGEKACLLEDIESEPAFEPLRTTKSYKEILAKLE
jgi:transcriptional regulator with XRE-family HTH domain